MMTGLIGGRYELLELLGEGGMGQVYRAVDRLTGAAVALKSVRRQQGATSTSAVPNPIDNLNTADRTRTQDLAEAEAERANLAQSSRLPVANASLVSEFLVLSALRHPNIVGVLDYGFDQEKAPYFTMTLLSGARDIGEAAKDRSLTGKLDLLFQMLEALSYLHRHGVVHRDLKPSNVMVTGDRVTVLDFGLSRLRSVGGTYGYMAPEILNGAAPSPLSDLYAVGVIALETLGGAKPHAERWLPGEPNLSLLAHHTKLSGVVRQLLAKDPAQRPADANRAIEALAQAAGLAIPAERVDHRESYLNAAPLTGRRRELSQLQAALQDAINGSGSAWLLGGESGVGKSRVLSELRSAALVRGAVALFGQPGNGAPFSVFRDAVLRLALLSELPDADGSVLKAAFPDLERVLGREFPDAPIDPATFPDRLANAVLELVRRCPSPIVLELEDGHLIRESLLLLNTLVQHCGQLPLLIVLAYRDNERPRLPQELPGANVMRLEAFNEAGVRDMVTAILGPALGKNETLVKFLTRETEGNAFFLVEAIRTLAEESGRLDRISAETLPGTLYARGMMDAVSRRLDSLPGWTSLPLRVAAILGRDVDVVVLRAACPDADMDRFLVECGEARILEGHGYQWRFTHDKLREGLIARVDAAPDPSLYAQAASAVESLHGESPAWTNVLARCWQRAGNIDKAVHHLLLASGQCLRAGATARAVDLGLEAVVLLGVEILPDPASQGQAVGAGMQRIEELLAGRQPADLLELPILDNPRVARIIEILEQIAPGAHINQRFELFALAVVKSMLLTLEYGVGPGSSFAFGTYALVLRNLTGDAHRAYAFGRLAVDTDIRLLGHGGASAMFVHYWFLHHWIHPIETNLEPTLESAATGLREGGDILYGGFSAAAYVIYLQASGAHLDQVVEQADVQLARIAGRVHVAVFQARQERQVAQALAGRTIGALSFTDQTYDEQRDLASILATPNYSQAAYHCRSKMQMHYLYRDYPGAMEWAERGLLLLPSIESQVGEWQFVFYYALTAAALAGQASGPEQQRLLDAARAQLEKFEQWSGRCPSNFAHRRDLIAAEILRASGDANAQPALEAALAAAESRGWLHDIALAHELLAVLHRANPAAARHHALRAADAYDRWGAKAKAADACAPASGPFIVAQL